MARGRAPTWSLIATVLVATGWIGGCGSQDDVEPIGPSEKATRELVVFHDASLSNAFATLARAFERAHPDVSVRRESSGGRTVARKVSEMGRQADFCAVTDYQTIQNFLMPSHADWYVCFAQSEMVIAYGPLSAARTSIGRDNWFKVLVRPDVSFGRIDPDTDPCGYRTEMVWQLADRVYRTKVNGTTIADALRVACPRQNVRPQALQLLPLLRSGTLDYVFVYRSVAEQHNLQYVELRPEVNLSTSALERFYDKARVSVAGAKPSSPRVIHKGRPIVYAFTIPNNGTNRTAARDFADFLLGPVGATLLEGDHQRVIPGGRVGFVEDAPPRLGRYR